MKTTNTKKAPLWQEALLYGTIAFAVVFLFLMLVFGG